jgi:hypothetical protein
VLQKQYNVKIFQRDGTTLVQNVNPKEIEGVPTFSCKINSGCGDCVLDLKRSFDNFGEGETIDFMYVVKIYAVTPVHPKGVLIYTGVISKYEPFIEASGQEGVRLTLLGLVSVLSFAYYRDTGALTVAHTSENPQAIGRAIIDHAVTEYPLFSYSDDTTDPGPQTVSITYEDQKWLDALKKIGELAGDGWWWKIDESGQYWLKPTPSTPTHTFTLKKDVVAITAPKDSEKVVNYALVRWDGGDSTETDGTSETTFGLRETIIEANELKDQDAGDRRAEKEVADKSLAIVKATITVDTRYAPGIESIKVGETCKLANYNKDSTFFPSNMLIVGTHYNGDQMRVDVGELANDVGRELDAFVNG